MSVLPLGWPMARPSARQCRCRGGGRLCCWAIISGVGIAVGEAVGEAVGVAVGVAVGSAVRGTVGSGLNKSYKAHTKCAYNCSQV